MIASVISIECLISSEKRCWAAGANQNPAYAEPIHASLSALELKVWARPTCLECFHRRRERQLHIFGFEQRQSEVQQRRVGRCLAASGPNTQQRLVSKMSSRRAIRQVACEGARFFEQGFVRDDSIYDPAFQHRLRWHLLGSERPLEGERFADTLCKSLYTTKHCHDSE